MKYYFVGIKGSGMSGLALIYKDLGNEVKGADIDKYLFTQRKLEKNNIKIDSLDNMNYQEADIIVVGNAYIDKYNFIDKKVLNYQEALSIICDKYYSIAVCGTHGKTTTTNMIKHVLSQYFKTSYLVGDGQGKAYNEGKYFVFEACEHRDHFLSYYPNIIVCLNVDYDHVEYFTNKKQYKKSFLNFYNQAKDFVILNDTISYNNTSKISFGLNNSNIKAFNIKYKENGIYFSLNINNKLYKDMYLPFFGKHILIDALACISCCLKLNLNVTDIIYSLSTYKEAGRRYNLTFINNNVIIDDYGHHPKEIKSTIFAIKQEFKNKKIYIIYHPDRPKRLTYFLNDYLKTFSMVEKTYVLPFINNNKEEEEALNELTKNNISLFNESFYNNKYENCVFLFTGSKEMKEIILRLTSILN